MAATNPVPPPHKPLHHHVLEAVEQGIDTFGMALSLGAIAIMALALIRIS